MDIEEEFKNYSDIGLMVGLGFGVSAIALVVSQGVAHSWLQLFRVLTFGLLSCVVVGTVAMASQKKVGPLQRERTLKERIIAGTIAVILNGLFGTCFFVMSY